MTNADELSHARRLRLRTPAIGWRSFLPLTSSVFVALALVFFVRIFARTLAVLCLSVAIADSFAPLISKMENRISRGVSAALVYGTVVVLLGGGLVLFAPPLVSDLVGFLSHAPDLLSDFQRQISQWIPGFSLPSGFTPQDLASHLLPRLVNLPIIVGEALITAALVFFLSFYWLLAAPSIHAFIRSLFPENLHDRVNAVLAGVSRAMGGYLRGVAINAAVVGSLVGVALHIAHVPYAFPLGVISALGEFVPYLGPILAAVPGLLVGTLQSPEKGLIVLLIYLGVIQIEGHVLTPNIMKSQTDVPQVIVIISLFAGGAIGGVLGALVAVPVAGAAMVLTELLVLPTVRRWTRERFGTSGT